MRTWGCPRHRRGVGSQRESSGRVVWRCLLINALASRGFTRAVATRRKCGRASKSRTRLLEQGTRLHKMFEGRKRRWRRKGGASGRGCRTRCVEKGMGKDEWMDLGWWRSQAAAASAVAKVASRGRLGSQSGRQAKWHPWAGWTPAMPA